MVLFRCLVKRRPPLCPDVEGIEMGPVVHFLLQVGGVMNRPPFSERNRLK